MGGFRFYQEPAEIQFLLAISPMFWHQGLGTEAAGALIQAGFGWGRLRRIVAEPAAPNPRAQKFLRRLGMRRVRPSGSGVSRFVLKRPGSDGGAMDTDVVH
jgi:RimJ/RimL family protein N-acetyltransferase